MQLLIYINNITSFSLPVELLENPHGLLSTQLDVFQILEKKKKKRASKLKCI